MNRRRKLFSDGQRTIERTVCCRDCGHKLVTSQSTSSILCSNCGGKRFNVVLFPENQGRERKSLFGDFDTPLERELKEASGKTMDASEFEKKFSADAEYLLSKGFANTESNGKVTVEPYAYDMEKMFSKVVMSVTKTMVLDKDIMNSPSPTLDLVESFRERLPKQAVVVLKKTHGCHLPTDCCTRTGECSDSWIESSRIEDDLSSRLAGRPIGLEDFISSLRGRYPDAPKDIIGLLSNRGTIRIQGGQVSVL